MEVRGVSPDYAPLEKRIELPLLYPLLLLGNHVAVQ